MDKNPLNAIIMRSCLDRAFREEFLRNPAEVLRREGISIPDGVTVKIIENTDERFHIVLPDALGRKMDGSNRGRPVPEVASVQTKDLNINREASTISLSGRITAENAQLLRQELDKIDKTLLLDFSEVTFLGSAGLAVLQAAKKRLSRNGQELYLCEVSAPIKNLFQLTGLDDHFKFVSRDIRNFWWMAFPSF